MRRAKNATFRAGAVALGLAILGGCRSAEPAATAAAPPPNPGERFLRGSASGPGGTVEGNARFQAAIDREIKRAETMSAPSTATATVTRGAASQ